MNTDLIILILCCLITGFLGQLFGYHRAKLKIERMNKLIVAANERAVAVGERCKTLARSNGQFNIHR